jgi:hypothetical protein
MHQEIGAGALADPLDQAVDGIRGERATAFGGEDEPAVGELPAQLAERPDPCAVTPSTTEAIRGLPQQISAIDRRITVSCGYANLSGS